MLGQTIGRIVRLGGLTIAFVVGLVVLLFFLGIMIQLWNGLNAFAQSGGSHGAGWWIMRIFLGMLGAVILSTFAIFIGNVGVAMLTMPAYGIGWLLGWALGRTPRPNVAASAVVMAELGKTLTGAFAMLAFYWYCILAPLWIWVPTWSLRIAVVMLVFVWTPGVALMAFSSRAKGPVAITESDGWYRP
ncbi:MAG: hypothetical protein Q8M79_04400 [Dehalococcoidia bacterium]|nr:hypothetical protein [Dehalococcoidia bacterium]